MPPTGREKKRLRDWLEDLLNTGQVPGMRWTDMERGEFLMVWRNGNNRAWTEEDGFIYREWAIHKGHYKPNPDGTWPEPDYPTWKSRLRCALNRCSDFQEIKQDQKVEWKMFRMVPKERDPTPDPTQAAQYGAVQPSCSTDMYINVYFPPNIPAVVTGIKATPDSSYEEKKPPDQMKQSDGFSSLNSEALAGLTPEQLANYADELMDISLENDVKIECDESQEMPDSLSLLSLRSEPKVHDMCFWLRYKSTVIRKCILTNQKGCQIYNPGSANIPALAPEYEMNGQHIGLPLPKGYLPGNDDQLHCEDIANILEYMDNGTQIFTDKQGDIYARRLSRCKIYCANASMNAAEPYKLPRYQKIKVFDFAAFQQQLLKAKTEGGKVPSVTVVFSLGQKWSWTKSINKMCISAAVASAKCWYDLRKFMSSRRRYPGRAVEETAIEVSLENMNLGD
ncbi:interferon regulatory factor 4-like isoform X1 [Lineus longissimus]|uniref:interferon regulatory factor 4-like isoform X1 n=1 Tax=Lineus longissimus TaxID=88925 RepID=UPI00315D94BC